MLNILALVGVITILAFLIRYFEDRKYLKEKEEKELLEIAEKYGEKSKNLYYQYPDYLAKYNKTDFFNKLKLLINEPLEKEIIETRMAFKIKSDKELDERLKEYPRDKMRIYYLYSDLIFQVFDINKEMSKHDIIYSIQNRKPEMNAEKVFKDCEVYLLDKCRWNNDNYMITEGFSEEDDTFWKEENIITHEKWLSNRGKVLRKEMSNEKIEYDRLRMENYTEWHYRYMSDELKKIFKDEQ